MAYSYSENLEKTPLFQALQKCSPAKEASPQDCAE